MKSLKFIIISAVLAISAFAGMGRAMAQGGPIDLQLFRPAMDSKGHFGVDSTQVLGHKKISIGLGITNAFNPLVLEGDGREFTVNQLLTAYLQFSIGLFKHFELGVGMPFSIMSGNTDPRINDIWDQDRITEKTQAPMGYDKDGNFGSQGAGDVFFSLKWRILASSKHPVGLAAMFSLSAPTGNADAFMSSNGIVLWPKIIVDKRIGKNKGLISLNLGSRIRLSSDHELTANSGWTGCIDGSPRPCNFVGERDNNGTQNVSQLHDINWGVGLTLKLSEKVHFVSELFGSVELSSLGKDDTYKKDVFPVEALAGLKLYLAANSFLAIGGGVGITGLIGDHVGAPDFRLFATFVFEPFIGDRDEDGYPDDVDKCPDDPEDFDGFQDEDGCPDLDNDQDGIPDKFDKCPNEPEDKDGYEDEDGCPEDNSSDRDGDGIPDDKDQCPDDPEDKDGFEDSDGCPDKDNDGDGIPDSKDLCPGRDIDKKNNFKDTKEDKDGFQDEDGCPDPDNDQDGIPDVKDKCPNEPETFNGFEDEDGCPDKGKIRVTQGSIEIYEKIYFATAKSDILPKSYSILDAIVATLKAHPMILKIEIQGHTDDRGPAAYNLKLSDDRANSVRQYLIDHGIAASRLTAKGYGKARPLEKKFTEEARAKNRRVEFIILERSVGKIK
ncbi:OmpA family protein [Myxococcota bacterium]|nr:OmpA family protein [Myxococcota bacterium]MBU1382783.1 OmpA family protein [Myxococcota bacterium]MBU1502660.1 OmpA family protein [bacterium]